MVGSPGQTFAHLAEDLLFLKKLNPQMVGIGPFIPHHDTMYRDEPAGSLELTLFLLLYNRTRNDQSSRKRTGHPGRSKRSHAEPFSGRSSKGLLPV